MKIKIADNFNDKLLGLMFKKNIDYGLLIKNCKSIHTFFMKESIDVLLLDTNNRILMINRNIKPNKILICKKKNKCNNLELQENTSINLEIEGIVDLNNFKTNKKRS